MMADKKDPYAIPWTIEGLPPYVEFETLEDIFIATAITDKRARGILFEAIPHLADVWRNHIWQWLRQRADWPEEQLLEAARASSNTPLSDWLKYSGVSLRPLPLGELEDKMATWRNMASKYRLRQLTIWFSYHVDRIMRGVVTTEPIELVSKIRTYLDDLERGMEIKEAELAADIVDEALTLAKAKWVETPWDYINEKIGGVPVGAITFIAAPPGRGKTCALVDLAWDCSGSHIPTLFVSAEMSRDAIIQRIISRGSGVEYEDIRAGRYEGVDKHAVENATMRLKERPLWILSPEYGIGHLGILLTLIRCAIKRRGIKLVLVDYLQIIKGWSREERISIGQVCRALKNLAISENVGMVVAVQCGRSSYDRKPNLRDLFGSSNIEQDADLILALWQPNHSPNHNPEHNEEPKKHNRRENILLLALKNRFGGWLGYWSAAWDRGTASFTARTKEEEIPF